VPNNRLVVTVNPRHKGIRVGQFYMGKSHAVIPSLSLIGVMEVQGLGEQQPRFLSKK
jgi:hypothetical protein